MTRGIGKGNLLVFSGGLSLIYVCLTLTVICRPDVQSAYLLESMGVEVLRESEVLFSAPNVFVIARGKPGQRQTSWPLKQEDRIAAVVFGDPASSQSFTDRDVFLLRNIPDLEVAYLADTKLTDQATDDLLALNQLRFLSVAGTEMTDVGMMRLLDHPAIEVLDVFQSKVTSSSVRQARTIRPDITIHNWHY